MKLEAANDKPEYRCRGNLLLITQHLSTMLFNVQSESAALKITKNAHKAESNHAQIVLAHTTVSFPYFT